MRRVDITSEARRGWGRNNANTQVQKSGGVVECEFLTGYFFKMYVRRD